MTKKVHALWVVCIAVCSFQQAAEHKSAQQPLEAHIRTVQRTSDKLFQLLQSDKAFVECSKEIYALMASCQNAIQNVDFELPKRIRAHAFVGPIVNGIRSREFSDPILQQIDYSLSPEEDLEKNYLTMVEKNLWANLQGMFSKLSDAMQKFENSPQSQQPLWQVGGEVVVHVQSLRVHAKLVRTYLMTCQVEHRRQYLGAESARDDNADPQGLWEWGHYLVQHRLDGSSGDDINRKLNNAKAWWSNRAREHNISQAAAGRGHDFLQQCAEEKKEAAEMSLIADPGMAATLCATGVFAASAVISTHPLLAVGAAGVAALLQNERIKSGMASVLRRGSLWFVNAGLHGARGATLLDKVSDMPDDPNDRLCNELIQEGSELAERSKEQRLRKAVLFERLRPIRLLYRAIWEQVQKDILHNTKLCVSDEHRAMYQKLCSGRVVHWGDPEHIRAFVEEAKEQVEAGMHRGEAVARDHAHEIIDTHVPRIVQALAKKQLNHGIESGATLFGQGVRKLCDVMEQKVEIGEDANPKYKFGIQLLSSAFDHKRTEYDSLMSLRRGNAFRALVNNINMEIGVRHQKIRECMKELAEQGLAYSAERRELEDKIKTHFPGAAALCTRLQHVKAIEAAIIDETLRCIGWSTGERENIEHSWVMPESDRLQHMRMIMNDGEGEWSRWIVAIESRIMVGKNIVADSLQQRGALHNRVAASAKSAGAKSFVCEYKGDILPRVKEFTPQYERMQHALRWWGVYEQRIRDRVKHASAERRQLLDTHLTILRNDHFGRPVAQWIEAEEKHDVSAVNAARFAARKHQIALSALEMFASKNEEELRSARHELEWNIRSYSAHTAWTPKMLYERTKGLVCGLFGYTTRWVRERDCLKIDQENLYKKTGNLVWLQNSLKESRSLFSQ